MSRETVKNILSHFEKLTQIPRPTRGEEKVAEHIIDWAKENKFEAHKDDVGNVYVYVNGSVGKENYPTITVQGHMDMVCEKTPESKIDPAKDPLKLIYEGDWLKAEGTTLGADNGVAIAFAMELATNKEVSHPPLELFFTVAEEEGFDGVNGLKPNTLKGKYLLNLDSDDNTGFTIASASTLTVSANLKVKREHLDNKGFDFYELIFDGALGGHSGIDIAKKRSNANMALMYSLKSVADKMNMYIASYEGGTKRNVIPRKAYAIVGIESAKTDEFNKIIAECEKYIKDKYTEDKNPHIEVKKVDNIKEAVTLEDSKKIIDFITSLPNGVESMSKTLKDTIEASNNIAIVKLEHDTLSVKSMQRGATSEGLMRVSKKIEDVFAKFNCVYIDIQKNVSKPWEPNPDSKLVKISVEVFKKLFSKEPNLIATHGGLECATIGEKHSGMDMISFGAIIEDLHSPEERLNIKSILPTWQLFKGIVEAIKD